MDFINEDFNFEFEVGASRSRTVNTEPEFVVTVTDGKFKINEAASRLLGIVSGEHLAPITNYKSIKDAIAAKDPKLVKWAEDNGKSIEEYPIFWGLAKGWKIEGSEEFKGAKMSNIFGNKGYATLEGSSKSDWIRLGGNNDLNIKFDIVKEPVTINTPEKQGLIVYKLTNMRTEAKIIKEKKADGSATEE